MRPRFEGIVDGLRFAVIVTAIVADELFFQWRDARPIRCAVHDARVVLNTLRCALIEKIAVEWRRLTALR